MTNKSKPIPELPGSSDAEKWLDPDHFIYKGKVYKIELNGTVKLQAGLKECET